MRQKSDHLFKVPKIIESQDLILRKLDLKDAKDFFLEINETKVLKFLHVTKPESVGDVKNLIRYFRKNWRKNRAYTFSIFWKKRNNQNNKNFLNDSGRFHRIFCGSVTISNINYYEKTGELGIWLGKKYWNSGINYIALRMMLNCGFTTLLLNKINALILPDNIRSIKTFQNLNFRYKGKKKNASLGGKTPNHILVYSIYKKEFEEDVGRRYGKISH